VLAVVNVLVSATQRDRLDGGTFRALNAGLAVRPIPPNGMEPDALLPFLLNSRGATEGSE